MTGQQKNRRFRRSRASGHPDGQDRPPPAHVLSDRSFGLVFAGVFGVWAQLNIWFGEGALFWVLVAAGFLSGSMALIIPAALGPFDRGWAKVAAVLSRIMTAAVMGAVFFLVLVPFAVVMRSVRKEDPLRLRPQPGAESYWIASDPPGDGRGDMERQY